ncbi:uncharacterized protein LOC113360561 [Papaver somniferum]|uniref:uncharacterized protein LOC113360561 n=1 Tax=Papaver somniferum TaxID=3469 RepID=UPI000E701424|nr:uncharacterized protein LOC113360561 [Papaver somniferum]
MHMHSVSCNRCPDPCEAIMHALVLCPFASHVWSLASFCANISAFSSSSMIDWLNFWLIDHLTRIPIDRHCTFVAILWSLWTSRNNLVFRNLQEKHIVVIHRAKCSLLEKLEFQTHLVNYILSFSDHWMPPTFGWIKCNIDCAFDDTTKDNGAGYVMRDFSSKVSFRASIVFDVDSVEEAEVF